VGYTSKFIPKSGAEYRFDLALQQTTTSVVSQAYQEVSGLDGQAGNGMLGFVKPMMDFVNHFHQLKQQIEQIMSPEENKMQQLMDATFYAEFGESPEANDKLQQFNGFIDKLS